MNHHINIEDVVAVRRTVKGIEWTEDSDRAIALLYPVTPNSVLAARLKISVTTLRYKAYELGVKKDSAGQEAQLKSRVAELYSDFSVNEIASMLGVGRTKICNLAKELGLSKNMDQVSAIISRKRLSLIKREKLRGNWGFEPLSAVKVFYNRKKTKMRNKLRAAGYFVERGDDDVFFDQTTSRRHSLEVAAERIGFTFYEEDCSMVI